MTLSTLEPSAQNNEALLKSNKTLVFKRNEIVYHQGQKIENIYIVLSGLISSVIRKDKKSKEDIILNKGSTLGLMDLILNRDYSKMMIAKNTSILAVINKNIILGSFNIKDYRSILIKSLALDVDSNNPNVWS